MLVWPSLAPRRLPPFGLLEAFTCKPEHLVWFLGQVCTFRPLPERPGLSYEQSKSRLPQLVSVTLRVLAHLPPSCSGPLIRWICTIQCQRLRSSSALGTDLSLKPLLLSAWVLRGMKGYVLLC